MMPLVMSAISGIFFDKRALLAYVFVYSSLYDIMRLALIELIQLDFSFT